MDSKPSKFQALVNDAFSGRDTIESQWKDLHLMNRQIAKRVMGWDYVRNDPEGRTPHAVYMKGEKTVAQHDWSPMTSMEDAWQVWQRLNELGYVLMVIWGAPIGHQPITVIQALDAGDNELFKRPIASDAPPMVLICQAALRIIGSQ